MAPQRPETSTETAADTSPVRRFAERPDGYRWEGIDTLAYKPTGTHFKSITRQVLFGEGVGELPSELRYFEVAPGGYSTLEKHQHVHAVLILRGSGRVLVGDTVHDLSAFDAVYVPPMTWHQFRATDSEPLGFLCLVACDRDRPIRPKEQDLTVLQAHPVAGSFIRV